MITIIVYIVFPLVSPFLKRSNRFGSVVLISEVTNEIDQPRRFCMLRPACGEED